MLADIFGVDAGIVLLIALVVIFGGSQLPKIAKNVGSAGKEFRNAQREADEQEAKKAAAVQAIAPPAVAAAPVVAPVPPPVAAPAPVATTPAAAAAPDSDKVTISKTELAALLDERLGKRDTSEHSN